MRVIKFRAIDEFGAIIYGLPSGSSSFIFIIDYISQYFGHQRKYGRENVKIIPETLGQFIGMYDKKGAEIYEGDIIQYDYWGDDGELCFSNMQIFWNEDTSQFCYDDSYLSDKTSFQELNKEFCSDVVVVGNIWQNKELLEVLN